MAWINPQTFEVLPYLVTWQPRSMRQWDEVHDWLNDNIGGCAEQWFSTGPEMQRASAWWFKNAQDAMMFRMVWC